MGVATGADAGLDPVDRPINAGVASAVKPKSTMYSNWSLDKIEQRISDIGRDVRVIDESFANPKVASDNARMKKLLASREELEKEQTALEEEWVRKSG